MTTKILALTDALGNLVRFRLMPGQRYDSVEVPPLIDGIAFEGLIADKAFDSNALVAELNGRGARVVISQHPARAQKLRIDPSIWRNSGGFGRSPRGGSPARAQGVDAATASEIAAIRSFILDIMSLLG